jgi:hypothetical protein
MIDEFPPPGWFLRPENWRYWMPSTLLGALPPSAFPSNPSTQFGAHERQPLLGANSGTTAPSNAGLNDIEPAWLSSLRPPATDGGLLGFLTRSNDPGDQDESVWSRLATSSAANGGLFSQLAQSNSSAGPGAPAWPQPLLPFGADAFALAPTVQPNERAETSDGPALVDVTIPDTSKSLPPFAPPPVFPVVRTDDGWGNFRRSGSLRTSVGLLAGPTQVGDQGWASPWRYESSQPEPRSSRLPLPAPNGATNPLSPFEIAERAPGTIPRGYQQPLAPSQGTADRTAWGAPILARTSHSALTANPTPAAEVTWPSTSSPITSDADPEAWLAGRHYAQVPPPPRRGVPGAGARAPSPLEEIRLMLYAHAHRTLRRIEPRNPQLKSISSDTWVPTNEDLNRLNWEIETSRRRQSILDLEAHHAFPLQFSDRFERAGINTEDYIAYLPKDRHRLRPSGAHTGTDNWNAQWRRFFEEESRPSQDKLFEQLRRMLKELFGATTP